MNPLIQLAIVHLWPMFVFLLCAFALEGVK
jgi:hypothetical protein